MIVKVGSKEYFEFVKFSEDKKLIEMLTNDKEYLFEYDYFKQTGYHWAAKRGNVSTLGILISFGKHLNLKDNNLRTPLFLAAKNNHLEALILLFSFDANPFIQNIDGKLPVDVCSNDQCKEIIMKNMEVLVINYRD